MVDQSALIDVWGKENLSVAEIAIHMSGTHFISDTSSAKLSFYTVTYMTLQYLCRKIVPGYFVQRVRSVLYICKLLAAWGVCL